MRVREGASGGWFWGLNACHMERQSPGNWPKCGLRGSADRREGPYRSDGLTNMTRIDPFSGHLGAAGNPTDLFLDKK